MIIKAYKAAVCTGCRMDLEKALAECEPYIRKNFLETNKVMNVNVFTHEKNLYIYIESIDTEIPPDEIMGDAIQYLCERPDKDGEYFYLLSEIFHFNEPQSVFHWKRKEKPLYCFAMLAKIVPELTARYVFYHYQFQEERPGLGDKYARIYLMEDIAFYYGEAPEILEPALHKGALDTHNTPDDDEWQSIMGTHFRWWDEKYPAIDAQTYDWKVCGYPLEKTNNQWLYIKNILSVI